MFFSVNSKRESSLVFSGCSILVCFLCVNLSVWYFSTEFKARNEVMNLSSHLFFLESVFSSAHPAPFCPPFHTTTLIPSTAALAVLGKFHTAAKRRVAVESKTQVQRGDSQWEENVLQSRNRLWGFVNTQKEKEVGLLYEWRETGKIQKEGVMNLNERSKTILNLQDIN